MFRMPARVRDLKIRTKLLIGYSLALILVTTAGGWALYAQIRQTIEATLQEELDNTTATIVQMVETSATVSIRNHLRARAENNRAMVEHFYGLSQAGELTEKEAQEKARTILLAQHVGREGYPYCVDSHGTAVIHPDVRVEGIDFSERDFVQQQIRRREGYLEYDWCTPGDPLPRPKALYMTYFEPWDWIISVSSYRDDFASLVNIDDFRESLLALRFGPTGYAYILDSQGGIVLHPKLTGNLAEHGDPGQTIAERIGSQKQGQVRYLWQNPGEARAREKLVSFTYLPAFDWIVCCSCYLEEIYAPMRRVRTIFALVFAASLTFVLILSLWIGAGVTRPLKVFMGRLEAGAGGDLSVRMDNPSRDELGTLARYFNTFMERLETSHRDLQSQISERLRSEKALAEAKEKYRLLADSSPDVIVRLDHDCRHLYVNPAVEPVLGRTPAELMGHTMHELGFPEHQCRFWEQKVGAVYERGQPSTFTFTLGHGEGQRTFDCRIIPEFGPDGRVQTLLSTSRDITRLARAEERLRRSERRYRQLFETLHDGFALYEGVRAEKGEITDFRLIEANPALEAITGRPLEELIGRTLGELLRDFDAQALERCRRVALGGESFDYSQFFPDLGRHLQIKAYSPEPGRMATVFADITRQMRLEEQLQQTAKMEAIGQLAGGIAHDFNNLLTGILGHAELLGHQCAPESPAHHSAQTIEKAALRATELTRALLGFARKGKNQDVVVDLHTCALDVVELLQRTIAKDIQVTTRLEARQSCVKGDPSQMQQMLLNLALNARDAMPAGGRLGIATADVTLDRDACRMAPDLPPGDYLRVTVTDSGNGIPPEHLPRIFEPFFTTKDPGEGTGMGLAMVYGIVRNHGGIIQAASQTGEGATFTILLPATGEDCRPALSAAPERGLARGAGRILLIDDEEIILDVACEMLRHLGYEVTPFARGSQAVDYYREHASEIDLAVIDMVMPQMDGQACFRALREINPGIRALLSTGYGRNNKAQELLDEGMAGLISKPSQLSVLGDSVRLALADGDPATASPAP